MALKPLRPCRRPGCGALTREGYCPLHKPKPAPRSREAALGPSLGLRPNDRSGSARAAWRRWYSLKIWTDDLRPGQLLREPFCRECARYGIRTPATDVDHIQDHKGDWELFTDPGNLQSLCHSCHSRKTAETMTQTHSKRGKAKAGN